jgi:hypothetical protein
VIKSAGLYHEQISTAARVATQMATEVFRKFNIAPAIIKSDTR